MPHRGRASATPENPTIQRVDYPYSHQVTPTHTYVAQIARRLERVLSKVVTEHVASTLPGRFFGLR